VIPRIDEVVARNGHGLFFDGHCLAYSLLHTSTGKGRRTREKEVAGTLASPRILVSRHLIMD
jgi:hypothetical protein